MVTTTLVQINEFRYDSQNEVIKNTYWGLYGVIYDCNLILDNIEPTTSIKKRVCLEARTLARAWSHMMPLLVGTAHHWLTIFLIRVKTG